jgi:hypothetical protein
MEWLKRDLLRVFPAFLFFWIAFTLINYTEGFLLERAGIERYSWEEVLLAAALVAKILMVVDNFHIANLFPITPLYKNIIWKTLLYWMINAIIRLTIRFSPYVWNTDPFLQDVKIFSANFDWAIFLSIQSWYLMLFFVFVTTRELTLVLGPKRVFKLFFSKISAANFHK